MLCCSLRGCGTPITDPRRATRGASWGADARGCQARPPFTLKPQKPRPEGEAAPKAEGEAAPKAEQSAGKSDGKPGDKAAGGAKAAGKPGPGDGYAELAGRRPMASLAVRPPPPPPPPSPGRSQGPQAWDGRL